MPVARVLLRCARNLPKADLIGSCDAFMVATVGPTRYQTKVIWNQYSAQWNEACDFEFGGENGDVLRVEVYDKDLMYDEFIGSATLNLKDLLLDEAADPYTVIDQELGLSDKSNAAVIGQSGKSTTVVLAAYLVGESTSSIPITCHTLGGARPDAVNLTVTLKEVQHLPKMDVFGTCDAYAIAFAGDRQLHKTKVVPNLYFAKWDEPFPFAVGGAQSDGDVLRLDVMDWDRATRDDFVGSVQVQMEDLVAHEFAALEAGPVERAVNLLCGGQHVRGYDGLLTRLVITVELRR